MSALESAYGSQFYFSIQWTQLIKPIFHVSLHHQSSTTVSLLKEKFKGIVYLKKDRKQTQWPGPCNSESSHFWHISFSFEYLVPYNYKLSSIHVKQQDTGNGNGG